MEPWQCQFETLLDEFGDMDIVISRWILFTQTFHPFPAVIFIEVPCDRACLSFLAHSRR